MRSNKKDMNRVQQSKNDRLAALLQEFREKNNLTGRKLAAKLGISQTSILGYLDGSVYPGVEIRSQIATAIGMTLAELDAYLEDMPLEPINPLSQTLQDIRAMSREDFLAVVEVVFERIEDDLKRNS